MIAEIKLFELLKTQFGEKDAQLFVQLFQETMDHTLQIKSNDMATKKDISLLKAEAFGVRSEILRAVYITSVIQLLAIAALVITLVLVLK